jgi:hypothetical protein
VAGDQKRAKKCIEEARRLLDRWSLEEEDRSVYMSQIRETESLIAKLAGRRGRKPA